VTLVFPLDFGHRQQAVDEIFAPAAKRVTRGGFVFDDIATLEPARAVHRCEPAADMTQEAEHASNHRGPHFADFVWSSAKARKHLSDQLPVMPFLVLDSLYPSPFVCI